MSSESAPEPAPFPFPVYPSLEAVPKSAAIRQVYPEDLYPNGNYVQLPYGRTRYWLLGPEDGIKVVLIHGISTPSITWKLIAPYLAERRCRILLYDLYGKGYSEAPKTVYNANLFITQLALLLQYLRWDTTHLVGFSMGGGVAAAFAATFPHLLAGKVILTASAGMMGQLRVTNRDNTDPLAILGGIRKLQAESLPGYKTSMESCFKDGPLRGLEWAFTKLPDLRTTSGEPVQVELIHGTAEEVVPYSECLKIKERVPAAKVVPIEGANHDCVVRDGHWQQVAQAIGDFLI
ncbi:alpha/beta-hydrolase [Obba rivulosa]|uniref:Alpha/beta-hydrolase n=1 Tax=Obba rivulosa TaxID=1052685 RepID=A0A8E2DV64_9APHY|nr:alpha/beta-hydrolase [Obba rivulosa]